jgi:hypothetical protein
MTNVIELFPVETTQSSVIVESNNKNAAAEKELLEYLMWSMRTEQDPHTSYDDPITEFRAQTSSSTDVA